MRCVLGVVVVAVIGLAVAGCGSASSCRDSGEACTTATDCCSSAEACVSAHCAIALCTTTGQPCGAGCCDGLECTAGKCAAPVTCRDVNGACAGTGDCCLPLVCSASKCVNAPSCRTAGLTCSVSSPCCSPLGCAGGLCGSCSAQTKPCSTANDCCDGLACYRNVKACHTAANLNLGDPCRKDSECSSGVCSAWCTKNCVTTTQCTNATVCTGAMGGGTVCFPLCQTNADCTVFGTGVTCQPAFDINGGSTHICSA